MELEFQRILLAWALSKPFVTRLWVFGSRARGTHRPDSDLDVAIEIISRRPHETAPGLWMFEKVSWKADLQSCFEQKHCRVKTHLCHYYDLDGDPEVVEYQGNIVKGVQADGLLIYDSNTQPTYVP